MKILAAGSTGVIGRLLVPLLVKAGYEVIGMTSNASHSRMLQSMGAQPIIVDVLRDNKIPATDGIQSFVHIEDAARAAYLALHWPSGPVNIVDDEPALGTEWLPIYADTIGAPEPEVQLGSGRGERGASNDKARKQYGWEPLYPTWRKGFRELV